jgi:uncharacterized protein YceH (UPF0502 family)
MRLPRQAGQKDVRYIQLLSGTPNIEEMTETATPDRTTRRANDSDRLSTLEQQVQSLTEQIANLTEQFDRFKKQFE